MPVSTPQPANATVRALWESTTANDRAYQAEVAFVDRVARLLNAVAEKTKRDDLEYDFIVAFPRLPDVAPKRVQVRFRANCDFPVGQIDQGRRAGKRDARRHQAYRGGVDVFVLVTWWNDAFRWYVIPAKRLVGSKRLKITPGKRRTRRGLDPESYVETWHHLAAVDVPVGTPRVAVDVPVGTLTIPDSF